MPFEELETRVMASVEEMACATFCGRQSRTRAHTVSTTNNNNNNNDDAVCYM